MNSLIQPPELERRFSLSEIEAAFEEIKKEWPQYIKEDKARALE